MSPDQPPATCTVELLSHINLDEVLPSAVRLARDILNSDLAAIALLGTDGYLTLRSQHGFSQKCVSNWRQEPSKNVSGIVFQSGRPYVTSDFLAEEKYGDSALRQHAVRALLVAPLKIGREVVGCLYVGWKSVRSPSADELRLASLFADQVSISIEGAALLERERQQRKRSDALLEVVRAPSLGLSLKRVLVKLCQSVLKVTAGERCSIFLFSEETHTLEPIMSLMSKGAEDPVMWGEFRASAGLKIPEIRDVGEAIKAQEPIIEEQAADSDVLPRYWIETFGIKSLALYPLVHKEKTLGILEVDSFSKSVHFPPEEIETLNAVSKQAGIIIENVRLYEKEQGQRQRAEALVDVLTAAASTLSMRKVMIKLCQAVVNISVGDRCSIFMMDKEGRRLEPVMSISNEPDENLFQKFRNPARDSAASAESRRSVEAVSKWEEPIVCEDAATSPMIDNFWVETFGVKSIVQYPLRVKDRTIGMMAVDSFHDQVHFPQEEIDTMAAVAKQAAIVIENTRLHEQVSEQAITDPLTDLYNHRHLFERLEEEFARASRNNQPFAVMMMDLDNFKFFNDTYGHLTGDEALRFVGERLREALRTSDIIGRYGGDEFMAVLPETSREEAERTGERIMLSLAQHSFPLDDSGEHIPMGLSIGIACYPYDSGTEQELIALADAALYEAKRLGGGQVLPAGHVAASETSPAQSLGFGLLQGLLNALAHKDPYTRRHCDDNVRYVDMLAERLRLSPTATESLRKAALLHDVGKIAVPDSTLMKPGPLDAEEWDIMQQHVRFGEMIVEGIAQISDAIEPVACHHERYDGKGYPRGLKGKEIPLLGRILAVVDAYSAMTLDRPYRRALSREQAIQELREGAGTQFDPELVRAFLAAIKADERAKKKAA